MILPRTVVVPSSSTPIFDGSEGQSFEFTLTGDALAIVQTMTPGVLYTFEIAQDAMGGHVFTWPGNTHNAAEVSTAPEAITVQTFIQRGDGKLYAVQTGAIN